MHRVPTAIYFLGQNNIMIKTEVQKLIAAVGATVLKDLYSCPVEIINWLTDKGQFQYLTGLKGPQVGTYLYTTQFLSLKIRYQCFIRKNLIPSWHHFIAPCKEVIVAS